MSKVCYKCKEKELTEFYTDKRAKYGKQSECKKCHNEMGKNWIANNKEKKHECSRVSMRKL